jgi:hypothetical protein
MTDRVLSEFVDAWNAGRRPRVRDYLARLPDGPARDELADAITDWLSVAPTPAYSEGTRGAIRAEVARTFELSRLRERAGFSPRELAARVRSVLRRTQQPAAPDERLTFGELELDAASREVRRGGAPLKLTAKEFDLLWFLASHPRRVFSRDQLMDRVWGYEAALDTGTVTVHVRRLREKIEDDPSHPRRLETVWGAGYRFVP